MRKVIGIVVGLLLLGIVGFFGLEWYAKDRLQTLLKEDLPPRTQLDYKELKVSLWNGDVFLTHAQLDIAREDSSPSVKTSWKELRLEGFKHWTYLTTDSIHFSSMAVTEGQIIYYNLDHAKSENETIQFGKHVYIDSVTLATALEIRTSQDSVSLQTPSIHLTLSQFFLDEQTLNKTVPFSWEQTSIKTDSLRIALNTYDSFFVDELSFDKDRLDLNKASIRTNYDRRTLTQMIDTERDHLDFTMPEVSLKGLQVSLDQEDSLQIRSHALDLIDPELIIYRNRLVAPNTATKPLYGQMLRSLPFGLQIDSTTIQNASVQYDERDHRGGQIGSISFSDLNATIVHLGNTYKGTEGPTRIAVEGVFMNDGVLEVDWNFDVLDQQEKFRFKGSLSGLKASELNAFTVPNLDVALEGSLRKVYFDISGNENASLTHMRMDYDDFKVNIQGEGQKKKWLKSIITNIFIASDSESWGDEEFRKGKGEVARENNKSFFHFIWLSLKSALRDTMT
ncbi:hypothetical protein [Croceiramulus getboli]|nr:hypothetical protein P8624_01885 [Flavobacteriaceae bacterium YJPT1-3]